MVSKYLFIYLKKKESSWNVLFLLPLCGFGAGPSEHCLYINYYGK